MVIIMKKHHSLLLTLTLALSLSLLLSGCFSLLLPSGRGASRSLENSAGLTSHTMGSLTFSYNKDMTTEEYQQGNMQIFSANRKNLMLQVTCANCVRGDTPESIASQVMEETKEMENVTDWRNDRVREVEINGVTWIEDSIEVTFSTDRDILHLIAMDGDTYFCVSISYPREEYRLYREDVDSFVDSLTLDPTGPGNAATGGSGLSGTYTLGELSIKIPGDMEMEILEENNLFASRGEFSVEVTCTQEDIYKTSEDFAHYLLDDMEESGLTTSDPVEAEINGETWYWASVVYPSAPENYLDYMFVYTKDYSFYSVHFVMPESSLSSYKADIDAISATLSIDSTRSLADTEEAKATLVGEWDGGEGGYIIFNEDSTVYWYKDSSLSMDNVFVGTFEADNKIKTYGAGYVEGIYLVIYYDQFILDGEEQALLADPAKEYAMVLGNDGVYTMEDMIEGNYYHFKKVA